MHWTPEDIRAERYMWPRVWSILGFAYLPMWFNRPLRNFPEDPDRLFYLTGFEEADDDETTKQPIGG